jgi:hypothetical protein
MRDMTYQGGNTLCHRLQESAETEERIWLSKILRDATMRRAYL